MISTEDNDLGGAVRGHGFAQPQVETHQSYISAEHINASSLRGHYKCNENDHCSAITQNVKGVSP